MNKSAEQTETVTGAWLRDGGCRFTVWAPERETMMLHLPGPPERVIPMSKDEAGYFTAFVKDAGQGTRYYYSMGDGKGYPDPCSFWQPEGVHEPSAVYDHRSFAWQDDGWRGIAVEDLILYELHVGTFTPEGSFDAIIPRLPGLKSLGITAIELMPVAQFPGERNWGYDGTYLYAVQHSYGGPDGLKRLVDACHAQGIAVYLDVVYNHLGPEGNYLKQFGPYFTDKYRTPWGDALNLDGAWSDGVKAFLTQNAAYWFEQFHIDGLRLDAVHEMYDSSACSIWKLLQATRQICEGRLGRKCYLIAESDHNNPATVSPLAVGGQGFDMQWLDDFHHALYVLLHPAGKDRYEDFGSIHQLAKAFKEGFVHSGEYVRFRKRRHGSSSAGVPGDSFVVFNQNHDQVGNRPGGERLCQLVDIRRIKLAAAAVLLSPYIPMLFMGEEYADPAPFFYFVSHSEPGLIRAVREGRKEEFSRFPDSDQMPDAQDEATFRRSKLQWDLRKEATHREVWDWHRELIGLRRSLPEFRVFEKSEVEACALTEGTLIVQRQSPGGRSQCFMVLNFLEREVEMPVPQAAAQWTLVLHSQVKQPAPTSLNTGTSLRIEALSVVLYRAGE